MPIEGKFDVSDTIDSLLGTIPGPQDGESVLEYKSRINTAVATIVMALGRKVSEADNLIENVSSEDVEDAEQFYSATKRKFVYKSD
jgi:nitroimidazol reductase NimA-like FMN-containing flavoprotein (pyridoxamine 5'-phosphate oxidase superfamily)